MTEKNDLQPTTTAQGTTTLADRMKLALKRAGKSKIELARACNISHPSVSSWCNGRTKALKGATCLAAARFLGVSPYWLGRGVGSMEPDSQPDGSSDLIPVTPYRSPDVKAWMALSKERFEQLGVNPEHCFIIKAEGNGMSPTISDGDEVLVDTSDLGKKIVPSKVYAVYLIQDGLVRLLRISARFDGSLKVWGDNKTAADEEIIAPEDASKLNILGRVVARMGVSSL